MKHMNRPAVAPTSLIVTGAIFIMATATLAAVQDPDPPSLSDPVPELAYHEEVGGFTAADFNAISTNDRFLLNFEHPNFGSGTLDGVILRDDPGVWIRNNFGVIGGTYSRIVNPAGDNYVTSGTNCMVYGGGAGATFTLVENYFGAQAPVYAFGFSINRFFPAEISPGVPSNGVVRVYSDEAGTVQLGQDILVQTNGSEPVPKTWFGVAGETPIRHVTFTGASGSQYGIDDIVMVTTPIEAPQPVSFTNAVVDDVMGLEFGSTSGDVYRLEIATDPVGSNWVFSGMSMVGTGTNVFMFDPTGFSTQKLYRVMNTGP